MGLPYNDTIGERTLGSDGWFFSIFGLVEGLGGDWLPCLIKGCSEYINDLPRKEPHVRIELTMPSRHIFRHSCGRDRLISTRSDDGRFRVAVTL